MKKILFFLSIIYCQNHLPIGTTLSYKVSFSGVNAATGKLKILENDTIEDVQASHLQLIIKTIGITDKLYPINDKIDIWLEKETHRTMKIEKNINEGNYRKKTITIFYQKNNFAIINSDTINIPSDCQSPYSLIYSLGNNKLLAEKNLAISTLDGKKVTPVKLYIDKDKEIFVPSGKFVCDKITPLPITGESFKNEGQISIWFSKETRNQIPIKIRLKLKFGSLVMELINKV
mgnify:FL=1